MGDGPLSEEIYQMFRSDSSFNIFGIDVWNLPSTYVNTTFRTNSGITYPLLVQGRSTGIAYNMETNPVPSPTDVEHRGHVVIDQQRIIRYYVPYDSMDVAHQQEIIAMIGSLLDPCANVELIAPANLTAIQMDEFGPFRLSWFSVPCASRYTVFKSYLGDWTDQTVLGITTDTVLTIEMLEEDQATIHVVAEH